MPNISTVLCMYITHICLAICPPAKQRLPLRLPNVMPATLRQSPLLICYVMHLTVRLLDFLRSNELRGNMLKPSVSCGQKLPRSTVKRW